MLGHIAILLLLRLGGKALSEELGHILEPSQKVLNNFVILRITLQMEIPFVMHVSRKCTTN